ncbi:2'-5' RNA ligase [Solidesulfovibrio fructosivorans JJ]]|uniref:RNA 2',3'-cyclic phosphodiesterase n=1 Tax=Solidesulfovibrio fructosivorans JJ] TaxID=596151 RepID=E1JVR1_SOLFR|nr:RNA 2',3'-cyclic phosphodiesterase [Solidesulfovibrio fructosivorans]EFL51549.1 2'-5' RNA ligase [Solidesulfovibrio fructosivorans JJ]]
MDHVRAFVGLALPQSCQDMANRLGAALAPLCRGRISRVRTGQAHITLKFLGETPVTGPAGIEAVGEALAGIRFAPFRLGFAGGGFFPGPNRPRVIWAGLREGASACRELAAAVDAALAPLGIAPEGKPFAAHLTLARVREPERGGDWPAMLALLAKAQWPSVPVAAMTLWRSVLSDHGARHEALREFPAALD